MMDEKLKYQFSSLKWLYEMELLDDPQLINNLKQNIMTASQFRVKETEFLMSQEDKKILIWIELNWFWQRFGTQQIKQDIYDVLSQLLPTYQFRIVTEKSILELAVTKMKQSLRGGTYAVSNNDISTSSESNDSSGEKTELQETSDLLPDQEKPSEDKSEESDESVESDLQSNEEIQDPS